MKPRRDKAKELFEMARDLSVSDEDFASQALSLTKRMTPINREFVICFAGIFREHAKQAALKDAGSEP